MNEPPSSAGPPGGSSPSGPPRIPAAEKPRPDLDQQLEQVEETTLARQARSAAFRDVLERKQHLDSLNRRIDVLQTKLDLRETEIQSLLPTLARLEQAEQVSKILVRDGTIIFGLGGALVSAAGLFADGAVKIALAGLGGGLVLCGLWIAKILNFNVWNRNPK